MSLDTCLLGVHLKHAESSQIPHRQPILADEVQTFKALITIHKILQEGHPIAMREAQDNRNWLESLIRGVIGDGLRGTYRQMSSLELRKEFLLQRLTSHLAD